MARGFLTVRTPQTPLGKAPRQPKPSAAFAVTSDQWDKAIKHVKKKGASKPGVFQEAVRMFLPAGVNVTTLKRRYHAGNTAVSKTGVKSWLPTSLEEHLASWLKASQDAAFCVTVPKLSEKAAFFASKLGVNIKGGRKWVNKFFARHPELSRRQGELLEMSRLVDGASIERWIDLNECVEQVHHVKPRNRWVMDETNSDLIGKRPKVVVVKGTRNSYIPDNVATFGHVSLLVAISAVGEVKLPLIIWQGDNVKPEWTTGWAEALHAADPSGYNNEKIMYDWFVLWEEATRDPDDPNAVRVIDIDNHFSHLGLEFLLAARAANVVIVGMHPHTTHLVCVLDGGVFASYKQHLKRILGHLHEAPSRSEYAAIMKQALQAATIITRSAVTGDEMCAAKRCYASIGLVPWNKEKLLSIAAIQDSGATEYKRQFFEQLRAAGREPDQEPPKVHLGQDEKAAIVDDLIRNGALNVVCARVPKAMELVRKKAARTKLQSEVLTSAGWLESAAEKQAAKMAEAEAKEARKKTREEKKKQKKVDKAAKTEAAVAKKAALAAKKAAKMAAKAARVQAKRGEASAADSASDAEFEGLLAEIEAAPRPAPRVRADMGEAAQDVSEGAAPRSSVEQSARKPAGKKKRVAGGGSAVDGAWRPAKRVR